MALLISDTLQYMHFMKFLISEVEGYCAADLRLYFYISKKHMFSHDAAHIIINILALSKDCVIVKNYSVHYSLPGFTYK